MLTSPCASAAGARPARVTSVSASPARVARRALGVACILVLRIGGIQSAAMSGRLRRSLALFAKVYCYCQDFPASAGSRNRALRIVLIRRARQPSDPASPAPFSQGSALSDIRCPVPPPNEGEGRYGPIFAQLRGPASFVALLCGLGFREDDGWRVSGGRHSLPSTAR